MYVVSKRNFSLSDIPLYPINMAKSGFTKFIAIIENSYPYSSFFYLKNKFKPSLEAKKLRELAEKDSVGSSHDIVQAITSDSFSKNFHLIHTILNKMSDPELNDIIKGAFAELGVKNPELLKKRLTNLLTLEKIEVAIQSQFPKFDTKMAANEIADPASRELEAKKTEKHAHFSRLVKFYIINALDWLVEMVSYAFMLRVVRDDHASDSDKVTVAALQLQASRENFAMISAWLLGLTLYTGSIVSAAGIAAAIAIPLIALCFIYLKYFKPPPYYLHPATNLTAVAARDELADVLFREKQENEVLARLETNVENKNIRFFPLLKGKSRIGKSDIINSIAKKLYLGEIKGPLANIKTVYSVNTSTLVDENGDPDHWLDLVKALRGYEYNSLVFVDEIQGAFKTDAGEVLGRLLLTTMDTTGLPLMVFACTDEDFEKYIKPQKAFMNRIKVIDMESLTATETYAVLAHEVTESYPDILISPEVLTELANITLDPIFADFPQPYTSKRILSDAIGQLKINELQEKQQLIDKLNEREKLDCEWIIKNNPVSYSSNEENTRGIELNPEIKNLRSQLENATEKLNAFKDLLRSRRKLSEMINKAAIKVDSGKASNQATKEFALMLNYLKPALSNTIEIEKEKLKHAYADRDSLQDQTGMLGISCPEITLEYIRGKIAEQKEILIKQANLDNQASNPIQNEKAAISYAESIANYFRGKIAGLRGSNQATENESSVVEG